MLRYSRSRIAILCATAAFLLLAFVPALLPFHRILFALFFLYLVLLPGWLLSRRLVPAADGFLRAASTFALGTALAFIVLFFIAVFRGDVRLVRIVIPAIVLALSLVPRPTPADDASPRPETRAGVVPAMLLIVLVAVVGALILKTGDPLIYTSDSPDHIAYIRTISTSHQAFPERFYYPEAGALTKDIRKGMIHALWGAVNALTGSPDAAAVWPLIGFIGSAFLLVSLASAGLLLFGSAATGLAAAILCVLFYGGGLGGNQLVYNASGYAFGRSFYVLAFALVPLFLSAPRPGHAALIALSLLAATGTHIAHLAAAIFIIAVFAISRLIVARGEERGALLTRRIPILLALAVLPNVPYLVMRYVRDYAPNNPVHTHIQGVLYLTDRLYVMNPLVFFEATGPLGALALTALFVLWRRARGNGNLRLLLNGTIAIYLLLFVPLWYPFVLEKMSYLALRFEFAVPSMILAAYLLGELWRKLVRRNPELTAPQALIGAAAVIVLLGIPLAKIPSSSAYSTRAMERLKAGSYRNLDDLFTFLRVNAPRGAVVASDPVTSFGIPAFTDDFAICPFDQHSTPNDSTAVERIADARRIFSPATTLADVGSILRRYGAGYLVVNGRIPPSIETMYWKPDAGAARGLAERLLAPGGPFIVAYDRDGVTVARLAAAPAAEGLAEPAPRLPCFGDSIDAAAIARLAPSGMEGIRIASARPLRNLVSCGDTVSVDIIWAAESRPPMLSYVAYLRFDTPFPKSALYRHAWGKPYRKMIERITGHRFRFRYDFQPLGGLVPPDTWPPMRAVRERVLVTIPGDVAPGRYTVSLRLADKPQYPNYVLGDILTDDDFYGGAAVAVLTVR